MGGQQELTGGGHESAHVGFVRHRSSIMSGQGFDPLTVQGLGEADRIAAGLA